eukprot:COSAG04_NODE_1940_length_5169_cov_7.771006_4_plen_51_part_00
MKNNGATMGDVIIAACITSTHPSPVMHWKRVRRPRPNVAKLSRPKSSENW